MRVEISQADQKSIGALIERSSDGKGVALNPGNETDRSAIALFLNLSGKTADRYPALYAALNNGSAAPAAGTARVVDLGRDSSGRATSRTWIGMQGLPLMSGATTMVLDADTNAPLAVGSATVLGEGLTRVATQSAAAAPAAKRQTALTLYHSMDDAGAVSFGAVSQTNMVADDPFPINVTQPVISVAGHTSIVIGLNRPSGGYNPDCDYNFYEDSPQANPNLLVPFVGNATLPYAITGIGGDGRINGLEIDSLIYVQLSAGQQSLPLLPDSLPIGCWSSTANPYQINWSFPYTDPQEPIVYTATQSALDTQSAFLFQFSVPINDPSSPLIFTVCSSGTPGDPSPTCKVIPNLQFTWHCVAQGTQITLADGSTVAVEDTHNQLRVKTGAGGDLAVEANWRGTHDGDALTLATDAGHKLTVTPDHPVQTSSGLVAARDLKVGDRVAIEGGATAALVGIESHPASGNFWNLMLGNAEDRAAGVSLSASTYIANGIVVGDFESLATQYRLARRNLDYMKARIPAALHTDYASAIVDAA